MSIRRWPLVRIVPEIHRTLCLLTIAATWKVASSLKKPFAGNCHTGQCYWASSRHKVFLLFHHLASLGGFLSCTGKIDESLYRSYLNIEFFSSLTSYGVNERSTDSDVVCLLLLLKVCHCCDLSPADTYSGRLYVRQSRFNWFDFSISWLVIILFQVLVNELKLINFLPRLSIERVPNSTTVA